MIRVLIAVLSCSVAANAGDPLQEFREALVASQATELSLNGTYEVTTVHDFKVVTEKVRKENAALNYDVDEPKVDPVVEVSVRGAWNLERSTKPDGGSETIVARNDVYGFLIEKQRGSSRWQIQKRTNPQANESPDAIFDHVGGSYGQILLTPGRLFGVSLFQISQEPGFHVQSWLKDPDAGEEVYQLSFSYQPEAENGLRVSQGFILCDLSNGFRVLSGRAVINDGGEVCFDYDYQGPQAFVKRTTLIPIIDDDTDPPSVRRIADTAVHTGDARGKEEYFLTFYGLAEPAAVSRSAWIWCLLVLSGIVLIWLSSRKDGFTFRRKDS